MKKEVIKKEKQERVEYFTDEMHKEIFAFQDGYKGTNGRKPVMKTITLSKRKK